MWSCSRENKGECLKEEGENVWDEKWIVGGS